MELRHLRSFVAVADTGGISRAASRLGLTQPALSRRIHQLEKARGVRLFDRVGRRTQLTVDGVDLLRRARQLLADAESLGTRARALHGGHSGVLKVGATPQTLASVFARFLVGYRRAHPGVQVDLTEDGGQRLLDLVVHGQLHLAVTLAGAAPLRSRLLFPTRMLAVMPATHRLARRRTIDITQLAGERVLLLRRDFVTRQWFDGACQLAHIGPRVALESAAPHALVALAQAGHGVAIVPSNVRLARSRLGAVPVLHAGTSLGGWLAAVSDPRRFLPPYAEQFVEALARTTQRAFPGQEFERRAPPVPRPDEVEPPAGG